MKNTNSTTNSPAIESVSENRTSIDWHKVRANYPGVQNGLYFTSTTRGLLSKAAAAEAQVVLDEALGGNPSPQKSTARLNLLRERFADLIGAHSDQIAVTKNVSEGLNAVLHALDWKPGDNVVITMDLEHPNNVYLWLRLADRGIEIRKVPSKNGAIDAHAMAAAINKRTRVVTASSVTFAPGHRADLTTMGKAARQAGALFMVDAVQSTGVLELDVATEYIDALTTSTAKSLLGLKGLGFLYVNPIWIDRLTPAYVARFSVVRGSGHESEIEALKVEYLPNAHKFEIGHYNDVGVAAAVTSIGEILDIGVPTIDARVTMLAENLARGFESLGYHVTMPPGEMKRSHIVTVGRMGAGGASITADPRLNRLAEALEKEGVRFTIRRGLLRFGLHFYNDQSDIDALILIADRVGS